jgi:hypothetical protein
MALTSPVHGKGLAFEVLKYPRSGWSPERSSTLVRFVTLATTS